MLCGERWDGFMCEHKLFTIQKKTWCLIQSELLPHEHFFQDKIHITDQQLQNNLGEEQKQLDNQRTSARRWRQTILKTFS